MEYKAEESGGKIAEEAGFAETMETPLLGTAGIFLYLFVCALIGLIDHYIANQAERILCNFIRNADSISQDLID